MGKQKKKARKVGDENYLKKKAAITLIALVITIIIMLILAGVSMFALIGNNGILNQTQDAAEKSIIADEEETLEKINNF